MPDRVWVSPMFPISTSLVAWLKWEAFLRDELKAVEIYEKYAKGLLLALDEVPKRFFGQYPDAKVKPLTEFFAANGFFCVNAAAAEIMSQFDLKPGGLVPIEIFQHDQVTRVPGEFFFINFGATKQAFNLNQTSQTGVRRLWLDSPEYGFPEGTTKLSSDVDDYEVAVDSKALGGPDVWTDPGLKWGVFFSDRLVQALKQAKLSRRFRFKQCKIV